jgi:hypothetical protein
MHPRLERGLQQFQLIDVGFSRYRASVLLATLLVVGLVGIAPSVAAFVEMMGLPVPRSLLLAVLAVGGLYVVLIVAMGRAVLGTCISLIVTSTFVANIPLTTTAPMYPGNLGPQLFLFELPMLVLVVIYAISGEYSLGSFTSVEYAFGAFVIWSVISAFFGITPRLNTALYFSLYMFVVWLGFGITLRSVRQGVIGFRGVLSVFLIAVYGHVVFSLAQFFNQGPFGFTVLGETDRAYTRSIVDLGVFGEYHIGIFLSGFTGGNSPLSVLLILAIPIALAIWRKRDLVERSLGFISVLVMVGILRMTAKDAARGAILITILCFMLLWLWKVREEIDGIDRIRKFVQRGKSYSILVVASIMMILYPSTTTGGKVTLPTGDAGTNDSNAGHTGGSTPSLIDGNQPSPSPRTISIPYFNLASLGIRFQQYVGAIFIFLDHPIFGVGGANYPFVAKAYGLPAKLAGNWFPLHNMYLAALAETGLPGFVFFMLAFVLVFRNGIQRFLNQNSDSLLAAGLLAGMFGYAAVMFWETNLRFVMVFPFWMLMGALVAENERL